MIISMKKRIRPGIAAVIFVKNNGKKKYLLLKRKLYWTGWEWIKGGKKKGESELACLQREIMEETGKNPDEYYFKKTRFILKFMYERPFVQDFQLWNGARNRVYLIEFLNSKIKLDNDEHSGFKWVPKQDALKMITHEDQRKIFKKIAK
jgi:8-oxo-dGTP pyrophosphatase MutT (NUDIX family)